MRALYERADRYRFIRLPSSSPAYAAVSCQERLADWRRLQRCSAGSGLEPWPLPLPDFLFPGFGHQFHISLLPDMDDPVALRKHQHKEG